MRRWPFLFLGLGLLSAAAEQQYTIATLATGAPPKTPAPGVAGPIGAPTGVVTDVFGNVYFSSPDLNVVFKLDSSGVLTRVAGSGRLGSGGDGGPATDALLQLGQGGFPSGGLTLDAAGNLFIADTNNHSVRRVSPDGLITTVAGNGKQGLSGDGGPATSAQLSLPWAVAVDRAGNLFIAEPGNFRVRKVSTNGIITTVAGGGTASFGDGGPATEAQLAPSAVAVDIEGNLFIAEGSPLSRPTYVPRRGIRKVSPSGIITTVAGGGALEGASADGGPATSAQLFPTGIAVDSEGNLFIADGASDLSVPGRTTGAGDRIRKVSPDGIITTVAGGGTEGLGDDGPATNAHILHPTGIAVDGTGNLFIADRLHYRVRKVSPSGIITTAAGDGTARSDSVDTAADGGLATNARLYSPWGVAMDRTGNLIIADAGNNRIRKISPDGIITTLAGTGIRGFSGDGGPASIAQLAGPISPAVDDAGNVYFVDAGNFRVRKLSPQGMITTLAGNGTVGSSGDGGAATNAALGGFSCNIRCGGVAADSAGNLFIADGTTGRVRRVSTDGIITTVFSIADVDGPSAVAIDSMGQLFVADDRSVRKVSSDGSITTIAERVYGVLALAVDSEGNIFAATSNYEAFFNNERIIRIAPDGQITTIAGTGLGGFSGDGGPASRASLRGPSGVALDAAGNIYITDSGNDAIRVLRPVSMRGE